MKKGLLLLAILLVLFNASAYGEEAIPERYLPILEVWGATDGESLKYNALLAGTMRMSAVYRYIC